MKNDDTVERREPAGRPRGEQQKVRVWGLLLPEVRQRLEEFAQDDGRSLSNYVSRVLEDHVRSIDQDLPQE